MFPKYQVSSSWFRLGFFHADVCQVRNRPINAQSALQEKAYILSVIKLKVVSFRGLVFFPLEHLRGPSEVWGREYGSILREEGVFIQQIWVKMLTAVV